MADGVVKPGQKPWSKQREKEKMLDGGAKVGCQHNEHTNLEGSLSKASSFLDRADDLGDWHLRKDVA